MSDTDIVLVAEVDGLQCLPHYTLQLSLRNSAGRKTQRNNGCRKRRQTKYVSSSIISVMLKEEETVLAQSLRRHGNLRPVSWQQQGLCFQEQLEFLLLQTHSWETELDFDSCFWSWYAPLTQYVTIHTTSNANASLFLWSQVAWNNRWLCCQTCTTSFDSDVLVYHALYMYCN